MEKETDAAADDAERMTVAGLLAAKPGLLARSLSYSAAVLQQQGFPTTSELRLGAAAGAYDAIEATSNAHVCRDGCKRHFNVSLTYALQSMLHPDEASPANAPVPAALRAPLQFPGMDGLVTEGTLHGQEPVQLPAALRRDTPPPMTPRPRSRRGPTPPTSAAPDRANRAPSPRI